MLALSFLPGTVSLQLSNHFNQQYANTINKRSQEDTFDGLVFMGIYIKGEKYSIGHQGYTADCSKQGFVLPQVTKEFRKAYIVRVKSNEVIDNHAQDRA